jgi:predicted O-methyltransferase YrrM
LVWEEVLASYAGKPGIHYLEVGVFEGRSVIWMLENVLTHPSARVTAVDLFPEDLQERFLANLRTSGFLDKTRTIKGLSQFILRKLEPNSFDIIYLDGGHTADMVLTDAVLSWELLKTGGLMIFDDYAWNRDSYPAELRPGVAVDAFITAFRNYLDIVHRDYQLIVRKKEGPALVDPYQTILGEHVFIWQTDELRKRSDGQIVDLSDSEKQLLKSIMRSRPDGETTLSISPKELLNPTVVGLSDRLDIDLKVQYAKSGDASIWLLVAASLSGLVLGVLGTLVLMRRYRFGRST